MVLGRIECGTSEKKPLKNKESKNGKRALSREYAMEDELLRLQRRFRGILAERKENFWALGDPGTTKLMLILKQEYGNIRKNSKIFRASNVRRDKILGRRTAVVLHQRNALNVATQQSEQQSEELMSTLSDAGLVVRRLSAAQYTETELSLKKQRGLERVAQMENRLEVANKQLDAAQHDNWRLRQKIDVLLKDRANFNTSWYKALTSLTAGKKFLTDMVDQTTLAYDQRDKWCKKLRSAQDKGKIDMMMHMHEMRELQKSLHNDIRRHAFLAVKGTRRVMNDSQQREREELHHEQEQAERRLFYHKNILEEIQNYIGINFRDTEKIIENFVVEEHKNFALFRRLLQANAETVALKQEVADLKYSIASRAQWKKSRSLYERALRTHTQRTVLAARVRNSQLRDNLQASDELLQTTFEDIKDLFRLLECETTSMGSTLGDKIPSPWTLTAAAQLLDKSLQTLKTSVYQQERTKKLPEKDFIKKTRWMFSKPKPIYVVPDMEPTTLNPRPIENVVKAEPCSICMDNREESLVKTALVTLMSDEAIYEVAEANVNEGLSQDLAHSAFDCRAPRTTMLLKKSS